MILKIYCMSVALFAFQISKIAYRSKKEACPEWELNEEASRIQSENQNLFS